MRIPGSRRSRTLQNRDIINDLINKTFGIHIRFKLLARYAAKLVLIKKMSHI